MTQPTSNAERPRRRWFQFGLRGALIAVALVAVWLGWHMRNVNAQRMAVEKITRLGGAVSYDFEESEFGSGGLEGHARAKPPAWLRRLLGDDFVSNVIAVQLDASTTDDIITDADIACLRGCAHLKRLKIWCPEVTDAGVAHLEALNELELATLTCRITPEGARRVKHLKRLRILNLPGHYFTDQEIEDFKTEMPDCFVMFW